MQATLGTPEFWKRPPQPMPLHLGRWYHQLRSPHLDLGPSQALNPTIHQAWLPCPIPSCILIPLPLPPPPPQ